MGRSAVKPKRTSRTLGLMCEMLNQVKAFAARADSRAGQGVRDLRILVLFQRCFTAEGAVTSGDNQSVSPSQPAGKGIPRRFLFRSVSPEFCRRERYDIKE